MAYAAELASDGTVLRVIVIPDEVLDEQEYCAVELGLGGTWRRTYKERSLSANPRKRFAGPGFKLDERSDAFVPPTPTDDAALSLGEIAQRRE